MSLRSFVRLSARVYVTKLLFSCIKHILLAYHSCQGLLGLFMLNSLNLLSASRCNTSKAACYLLRYAGTKMRCKKPRMKMRLISITRMMNKFKRSQVKNIFHSKSSPQVIEDISESDIDIINSSSARTFKHNRDENLWAICL